MKLLAPKIAAIYFTSAIELARRMARAMAENHLSREIKNLTRPKLLTIDEVGYLTLEPAHASLLFQGYLNATKSSKPSSSPVTKLLPIGAKSLRAMTP